MPQAWKIPAGGDLWKVVSRSTVEKADEDAEGGAADTNDFDSNLDTRAKAAVETAVLEIRGAIENCGRSPVSVTAGSVPPEGYYHALAIAAYRLCMPKPSLLAVIMAEGGVYAPVGKLYKDATDWVEQVRRGVSVTVPTDPAGQDYATAVSDTNPAVAGGVRWGDQDGSMADYETGQRTDPQTGAVITLPLDMKT